MADEQFSTRAYVYTFVNEYGEEGPPSEASSEITVGSNAGVIISISHAPVAEKYGIVTKRLYRSTTGDDGTVYRLVAEIPVEQVTIADTLRDDELKEVLPSADWDPPPNDLTGIVELSGGMLCGWRGGQEPGVPSDKDYAGPGILCVTAPNQAHAWPIKYRMRFDYPILGVMPLDMGFVVFTEGMTYFVAGTVPEQFQIRNVPSAPRCIGRKSIASEGSVGYYGASLGPVKTDGQTFAYLLAETNSATDPQRLYAEHINEQAAAETAGWGSVAAEDIRRNAASFSAVIDDRLFQSFFYDASPSDGTPDTEWTFALYEYDLRSRGFPFLCGKWEYVTDATADETFPAGHLWLDRVTRTGYTIRGVDSTGDVSLGRLLPTGGDTGFPLTSQWESKEFTFARPFHPGVMYLDFTYTGPGGAPLTSSIKVKVEVIAILGDYETVIADESFVHDPSAGSLASPHNWVRRVQVLQGPRSHRIRLRVTLPSGYPVSVRRVIVAENMQELTEKLPSV